VNRNSLTGSCKLRLKSLGTQFAYTTSLFIPQI
jgi:hypothetical protein